MKKLMLLLMAFMGYLSVRSQCNLIHIQGDDLSNNDVAIDIHFDKSGKPFSISGVDEDGPHVLYCQTTAKGLVLPIFTGKDVALIENVDNRGSYMIGMGSQNEDGFMSQFNVNAAGQLVNWDFASSNDGEETSVVRKNTYYQYDDKNNVVRLWWKGKAMDTGVTDSGEMTITYDLAKPDVLPELGTIRFLVEMNWLNFPMTNKNLVTGYHYSQLIHVPESTIVIGRDKDGKEITKTVPEKNIHNNVSKKFEYSYNSQGKVTGIRISGDKDATSFKLSYTTGKCEKGQ